MKETETEKLLEVRNLTKEFNLEAGFFARNRKTVYAVNDVSFHVYKGETYGIVGESGCGKTTTTRLIIRMYRETDGKIFFEGKDVSLFSKKELKEYREKVKYVFQDPSRSLNPRLTVYKILTEALIHSSKWPGKEKARFLAENIIEECGLSKEDLDRHPGAFSGGQRQRISIARGLMMNPELLICDEVVSALDVSVQGQILNLLSNLKKSRNLSYIFITHDLKVACYFSDRIGVMFRGILVEEGEGKSLYKTARHPYTKLLFEGASGDLTTGNAEVRTNLEKENSCPFAYRCPYALDKCRASLPPLEEIEPGRRIRCYRSRENLA